MSSFKDIGKRVISVQISTDVPKKQETEFIKSIRNIQGFCREYNSSNDNDEFYTVYKLLFCYEPSATKQEIDDYLIDKIKNIGDAKLISVKNIDLPISVISDLPNRNTLIDNYIQFETECRITKLIPRQVDVVKDNDFYLKLNQNQKQLFYNLIYENKEVKNYLDTKFGEQFSKDEVTFTVPSGSDKQRADLIKGLFYYLQLDKPKNDTDYTVVQTFLRDYEVKYEQRFGKYLIKNVKSEEQYINVEDVQNKLKIDVTVNQKTIDMIKYIISEHTLMRIDFVKIITDSFKPYNNEDSVGKLFEFFQQDTKLKDAFIYDQLYFLDVLHTIGLKDTKKWKNHEHILLFIGASGSGKTQLAEHLYSFKDAVSEYGQILTEEADLKLFRNGEDATNAKKEANRMKIVKTKNEQDGSEEDNLKAQTGLSHTEGRNFNSTDSISLQKFHKQILTTNVKEVFPKGDGYRRFISLYFPDKIDKLPENEFYDVLEWLLSDMQSEIQYIYNNNKKYYFDKKKDILNTLFQDNLQYTRWYPDLTFQLKEKGYTYDLDKMDTSKQVTIEQLDDNTHQFNYIKKKIKLSVDYGLVSKIEGYYSIIRIEGSEASKQENMNNNGLLKTSNENNDRLKV